MTKVKLIELLKSYKSNLYILKRNKLNKNELIEEICLSSPILSDIPKSITNKFNSKTENAVLRIDEEIHSGNEAIKNIALDVINVDWLLETLSIEQRLIMECKYILECKTWLDIAKIHADMFKTDILTKERLKQIHDETIERMINQYEKCD
jgi:hypothetical protein